MLPDWIIPDWLILKITDKGPGHAYRFYVEGENHANAPCVRPFYWNVPDIRCDRYGIHPNATPETIAAVQAAKKIETL